MSAIQRDTMPQEKDDEQTSLRVPKLKLKLSKPFQKPIESEPSSTESDSDSENDDEENISNEQCNISNETAANENELAQQSFSQPDTERQQYPYDANNCLLDPGMVNNNYDEDVNESRSSTKNTSTDSDIINIENKFPEQDALLATPQDELSGQLHALSQVHPIQEQTSDDSHNMTSVNVSFSWRMNAIFSFHGISMLIPFFFVYYSGKLLFTIAT